MHQQKGLIHILFLILLASLVVGGLFFYSWQKGLIRTTPPGESANTPPSYKDNLTSDWETFESSVLGLLFKYPPNFDVTEENGKIIISSPTHTCETETIPGSGINEKIKASEVKVDIILHKGKSFNEAWKNAFGFEFKQQENEITTIGGKKAYYFAQGAEMTFGRYAHMIEIENNTNIEINSWTPVLVYNCDKPLNEYSKIAHQILSTIKFLNKTVSVADKINAVKIYKTGQLTDWESELIKDVYWPKLKPFNSGDNTREVYLVDCEVTQTGLTATGIPTLVPNVSNIAETTLKKLLEKHYGGFPDSQEIERYEKASGINFKNKDSGINGVRLENGVLTINFYDSVAAYGGGSSRVACMDVAAGLTAKQFPTISSIKMCIDKYNNCELDFQP